MHKCAKTLPEVLILSAMICLHTGCGTETPATDEDVSGSEPVSGGAVFAGASAANVGQSLDDEQVKNVMDAIAVTSAILDSSDVQTYVSQMLQCIATLENVAEYGFTTDGMMVWARLVDGELLLAGSSRNSATPDASSSKQVATSTVESVSTNKVVSPDLNATSLNDVPRAAGTPADLPPSRQAFVGCAFGDFRLFSSVVGTPYFNSTSIALNVSGLLNAAGYTIHTDVTVEGLKTVKQAAVLYIDGHGGVIPAGDFFSDPTFVMETASLWSTGVDVFYKDDLKPGPQIAPVAADGHVDVYPLARMYDPSDDEWHYAITYRFVDKYWTFAKNGLVFLNACKSATPEAVRFHQACFDKGAALFIGWDGPVRDPEAASRGLAVFDRMLGRQSYGDPNPPVENAIPMNSAQVAEFIPTLGSTTTPPHWAFASSFSLGGLPVNMVFHAAGSTPVELIPIAKSAVEKRSATKATSGKTIEIDGEFPTDLTDLTVYLDSNGLSVVSSDQSTISVTEPVMIQPGDIEVVVDGRHSNKIPFSPSQPVTGAWTNLYDLPDFSTVHETGTCAIEISTMTGDGGNLTGRLTMSEFHYTTQMPPLDDRGTPGPITVQTLSLSNYSFITEYLNEGSNWDGVPGFTVIGPDSSRIIIFFGWSGIGRPSSFTKDGGRIQASGSWRQPDGRTVGLLLDGQVYVSGNP